MVADVRQEVDEIPGEGIKVVDDKRSVFPDHVLNL